MPNEPGQGFARRVTRDSLTGFIPLLRVGEEAPAADEPEPPYTGEQEQHTDDERAEAENLFTGVPLKVTLTRRRPARTRKTSGGPREARRGGAPAPDAPPEVLARGELLWRKRLSRTDAQRQTGHATGGMRLVQAKFRDGSGNVIDQTSYFRNDLFGAFQWSPIRRDPFVEETSVNFEVTIQGEALGRRTLKVSHKPSGEAGQGNYTTTLHWGDLSELFQERDLTGTTLELSAPAKPGDPYHINID